MAKTKISEKESKLMTYLIKKVLEDGKTLNKEEIAQLKAILLKLTQIEKEDEEAEKKALGLSEVIDHSLDKTLIRFALKKTEKLAFEALPANEKLAKLKADVAELQKGAFAKLQAEQKKKAEEQAHEDFYNEHVKKHGKSL